MIKVLGITNEYVIRRVKNTYNLQVITILWLQCAYIKLITLFCLAQWSATNRAWLKMLSLSHLHFETSVGLSRLPLHSSSGFLQLPDPVHSWPTGWAPGECRDCRRREWRHVNPVKILVFRPLLFAATVMSKIYLLTWSFYCNEMKTHFCPIVKQMCSSLLFCHFKNATAYHLGWYKPSSHSTKEFHTSKCETQKSMIFALTELVQKFYTNLSLDCHLTGIHVI